MKKLIRNPLFYVLCGAILGVVVVTLWNHAVYGDDGSFEVPSDWTCVQVSDTEATCTAPPLVPPPTPTPTPTPTLVGGTVYCYNDGNHMLVGSVDVVDWQGDVIDTVTNYESLAAYGWSGCEKD